MTRAVNNARKPAIFNARLKICVGMVMFIKCAKEDAWSVHKRKKPHNVIRLRDFLKNTLGLKLHQSPSPTPDLKKSAPSLNTKNCFSK